MAGCRIGVVVRDGRRNYSSAICATHIDSDDGRIGQIGIGQVGVGQVGVGQVGVGQVDTGPDEVATNDDITVRQVRGLAYQAARDCALERGPSKVGGREVRSGDRGIVEGGAGEVGTGPLDIDVGGPGQRDTCEVSTNEIRVGEGDVAQVDGGEDCSRQVQSGQIGSLPVDLGEVRPGQAAPVH